MMKKNGFTLAEVLITLAIIGVVATMTLPALIANTGEQQAKTGLKKVVNTLAEAAQMSESIAGFSYDNLYKPEYTDTNGSKVAYAINDINADEGQSMESLLRARTLIDFNMTGDGQQTFGMPEETGKNLATAADTYVYFRDGSILMYKSEDTYAADVATVQEDGFAKGFLVTVDTNGTKGPNALSNCNVAGGNKAGANDYSSTTNNVTTLTSDPNVCTNKKHRAINDRFQVMLRGTKVEPVGPAAVWAFQN